MAEFNEANQRKAFKKIFENLTMHDVDEKSEKEICIFVPSGYGFSNFKRALAREITNVCHNEFVWTIDEFDENTFINENSTFKNLFGFLFNPNGCIIHP
jgi:hypothetical protein